MKKDKNDPHYLTGSKIALHDDHKKPVTRRDFLSAGLLSFTGYMMAPSIVQLLGAQNAFAAGPAQCATAGGLQMPAFVAVNLSGGGALAGNFIPLDQGRQMYTDYSIMGMGMNPPVITEFQGVKFLGSSAGPGGTLAGQFVAGLRAAASATTIGKTSFIAVAHPSQDDSNINKIDCSGLVTAAGLRGSLLPKLGRRESATGVNHDYAVMKPPAPLVVSSINDLRSAIAPAGAIARRLDAKQKSSVLKLIDRLSGSQAAAVASPNSASGTTLANLVSCATGKNVDLSSGGSTGIDPMTENAAFAGLWGMAAGGNQFGQNQNSRQAIGAMMFNALKGQAGAVGFDLGGYDYHGTGRANQDLRDNEAGQVIGRILESAALMNQKVFIQVQSDGSVSAPPGSALSAEFQSDHGISGMCYIIAFDPAGRPAMKDDRYGYQLGYFSRQMGASSEAPIGSSEQAGIATFANYMKFANQMDSFTNMLGRQYSASELDYVIRFA